MVICGDNAGPAVHQALIDLELVTKSIPVERTVLTLARLAAWIAFITKLFVEKNVLAVAEKTTTPTSVFPEMKVDVQSF